MERFALVGGVGGVLCFEPFGQRLIERTGSERSDVADLVFRWGGFAGRYGSFGPCGHDFKHLEQVVKAHGGKRLAADVGLGLTERVAQPCDRELVGDFAELRGDLRHLLIRQLH